MVGAHVGVVRGRETMRVRADGKFFTLDGNPFSFRGVTYGTFKPRADDGARFPARSRLAADLATIADAGFTVVRTYTTPPADLVDRAGDAGLRVLAGVFYPDWRYLIGASRRQQAKVLRE